MTTNEWVMLVGVALIVGAFAGGWVTLRVARKRHAAHLRNVTDSLQQKFAATIDHLRAGQVRAQTELEQARNSFKRQLASATDEPRAAGARAEERLRAAYEELDRIRRERQPAATIVSELSDGFAATRPMREGL